MHLSRSRFRGDWKEISEIWKGLETHTPLCARAPVLSESRARFWRDNTGETRPPTRWTDDVVKIVGICCIWAAQDRSSGKSLGEVFDQQRTSSV
ncbi:unnamed protein product [Leptidea sinapis]|uniref:Uncharacterized protein n=1 Tax=Leptidea sinapis TaxID=189913 RepID=A0A5E4QKA5_9NEOP|nr:unnamed protein product [Leptidea sinapis]